MKRCTLISISLSYVLLLLLCQGCTSGSSRGVVYYSTPRICGDSVYLLRASEFFDSEEEFTLHLEVFDLRGRLRSQVDLGTLLGGGFRFCTIVTASDRKLLLFEEGASGSGFHIYDCTEKTISTLPAIDGYAQFALDSLGEHLWVIADRFNTTLIDYETIFSKLSLTTFDTVQTLTRRGRIACARSLWKRDREILFSSGDSLLSLDLTTGRERYIQEPCLDFVSFGNDGFVTIDSLFTLTVQKKENVSIDTLYRIASDGSFSSVSLTKEGLFMAYKGAGGVVSLYDHEERKTIDLRP